MSYTFLLFLTAAAPMAMTLNAFTRKGGLGGIRVGIFALFGGAAAVSVALLGATTAQSAEDALPWVALVRMSIGLIGAGFVGTGFLLMRPNAGWSRNATLALSLLLPAIGAALVYALGTANLTRSSLNWLPTHGLLRGYDAGMILLGTVVLCAGAVIRWRATPHGRNVMAGLLATQVGAAGIFLVIRIFGGAHALHLSTPVLITTVTIAYWIAFDRWRVAGIGESGLALVFSRMPIAAVLLDLQTGRCLANPSAAEVIGNVRSAEEMTVALGLGGEPGQVLAAHDGRTLTDVRLENAPERLFDVSCHYDAKRAMGLLVLADVTERVQQAKSLAATVSELRATQDRLVNQEKVAALGVLVAGVNHEINNPLAYVSANLRAVSDYLQSLTRARPLVIDHFEGRPGASEALRAWVEDDEVAEACADTPQALAEALQGCAQIREIVASMRMLSRQQGEIELCDLQEVAASGLKIGGTNIAPSIQVKAELQPETWVKAVPGELMRVVTNLVVNAGHALGQRGNLQVRTFRDEASGEAVLEVADDGPGVPAHLRSRLFDAFFTTKAPGKGTGLGLAISAETARRHGGTLALLPTEVGATFQLRLPLAQPETDKGLAAPAQTRR